MEFDMAETFRLEEYKMLRTKSQTIINRVEDLERNVVLFCGAVFAFAVGTSFTPTYKYQSLILYVLPLAVSIVAWVRYRGLILYMTEVNNYTIAVERELGGEKAGWLDYYYSPDRQRTDAKYQQYRTVIWLAIIAFNAVAALGLAIPLLLKEPPDTPKSKVTEVRMTFAGV
jgi:hypothetical protein